MRGKVARSSQLLFPFGITPAYAGKSFNQSEMSENRGDHPRLCGEKRALRGSTPQQLGSPPPMRGKVVDFDHVIAENRITPAYAGKSAGCHIQPKPSRDHPRLCGEKTYADQLTKDTLGSPPPMRGKVFGTS